MIRVSDLLPPIKKFAGYVWAFIFFGGFLWWLISDTDIYQEAVNPEQWAQKQQRRAERAVIRKERTERMKELDQMECQIMLRAKAALVPVEIERMTTYGESHEAAEKIVMSGFELDKEMCEKYGISPSSQRDNGE